MFKNTHKEKTIQKYKDKKLLDLEKKKKTEGILILKRPKYHEYKQIILRRKKQLKLLDKIISFLRVT